MIFKKVGDDTFFGIQINGSVSWLENMRVTGFHGWGKQRKKVIPNLYEFVKSSLLFTADLEQKCKATA